MKFLILSLGLASVLVSGSSIACTGSSMCTWPIGGNPVHPNTDKIQSFINQIDDDKHFNENDHIACQALGERSSDGFCAFIEGGSGTAFDAKWAIQALKDHDCRGCSHIPINQDDVTKDATNGNFIFNYVSDRKGCDGVC